MKTILANLFKSLTHKQILFEVEDELQFHVEMLERKYVQDGMSPAAAKAAALRRFGSLEKAMKQCVNIRSRNTLLRRVLKVSLIILALAGLSIRTLGSEVNFIHLGDVLIMIAIAGRLFIYVRGLSPSTFLSGTDETCPSVVTETPHDASKLKKPECS